MPTDPREADGVCGNSNPWAGSLTAAQTGGASSSIPAAQSSQYAWPPTTVKNADGAASLLPTYTPTGVIPTLPAPTFTASGTSTISAGNGWANPTDTAGLMVPVSGCTYLSPWVESAVAAPPVCTPGSKSHQCIRPFECYGPQFHFTEGGAPPYVLCKGFICFLSWPRCIPSQASHIPLSVYGPKRSCF